MNLIQVKVFACLNPWNTLYLNNSASGHEDLLKIEQIAVLEYVVRQLNNLIARKIQDLKNKK